MASQIQLDPFPNEFPDVVTELIFHNIPFKELLRLRLMCSRWDKCITTSVLKNSLPTLRVTFSIRDYSCLTNDCDYYIPREDIEGLKRVLTRHSMANSLVIKVIGSLDFSQISSNMFQLNNLNELVFNNVEFSPECLGCFQELKKLHSVSFYYCTLNGSKLEQLSSSIRNLKFHRCNELSKEALLKVLQSLKERKVPLKTFYLELEEFEENRAIVTPSPVSLTQFCLENFSSLIELESDIYDFPAELDAMVAINLEFFKIKGINHNQIPLVFKNEDRSKVFSMLFSNSLSCIQYLQIPAIGRHVMRRLVLSCSPLTLQHLKVYTHCSIDTFLNPLLAFSQLETVNIDGRTHFRFNNFMDMLRNFPMLSSIQLNNFRRPTGEELALANEELNIIYKDRIKDYYLSIWLFLIGISNQAHENVFRLRVEYQKVYVKNSKKQKIAKFLINSRQP